MVDLEQLQILGQLIDDMDLATVKLEEAYAKNNAEGFKNARNAILDFQKKIAMIVDRGSRVAGGVK